jgi:hypothetical protein
MKKTINNNLKEIQTLEADAFEQLKRKHFEKHGVEMSEQEAEDVRYIAQMFAEIALESWFSKKKKFLESKKTVPKNP